MSEATLDRTFSALSDPTRRAILTQLAAGETTVSELAAPFSISPPAISRHLRVLERAGLISQKREGQFRKCSLKPHGLSDIADWLLFHHRFWNESFERLNDHLKTSPRKKGGDHDKQSRS
jgi:DNA-binding transcriptional ArsR family regulator